MALVAVLVLVAVFAFGECVFDADTQFGLSLCDHHAQNCDQERLLSAEEMAHQAHSQAAMMAAGVAGSAHRRRHAAGRPGLRMAGRWGVPGGGGAARGGGTAGCPIGCRVGRSSAVATMAVVGVPGLPLPIMHAREACAIMPMEGDVRMYVCVLCYAQSMTMMKDVTDDEDDR